MLHRELSSLTSPWCLRGPWIYVIYMSESARAAYHGRRGGERRESTSYQKSEARAPLAVGFGVVLLLTRPDIRPPSGQVLSGKTDCYRFCISLFCLWLVSSAS